jgi:23S rRNA pseudouridine1911/1915/1917 synthase
MGEVWQVPTALDDERLDRALALLTGLSRREVNHLVDGSKVMIGGQPVTSRSRKVRAGERMSVEGPLNEPGRAGPVAEAGVDVAVVWSDDQVIVVDKPAGLVVHPGAGNRTGTLVHGLLARFPDLVGLIEPPAREPSRSGDRARAADQRDRPGIVHRLDKGTSGLLMVARTPAARAGLVMQLSRRLVGREYVALVAGTVDADGGLIDAPLGRGDRDPTRIRVDAGGRQARTRYQVEARYDLPAPTTLLRCRLDTGRTHQIRVHLASIGHPVIGDDRYGSRSVAGWRPLPPGRSFLHAAVLAFDHPISSERLSFSSPLPEDLARVLEVVGPSPAG